MREIRPLLLPKLVAARRSLNNSMEDMSANPASSIHSLDSHRSASECSTPLTPTFSTRHERYPSSNSSLASSPPTYEHREAANSSSRLCKLAKLEEELVEPEDDYVMLDEEALSPCLCDVEYCAHQTFPYGSSPAMFSSSPQYEGFLGDDVDRSSFHFAKRRRSDDSPISNFAGRLEGRFPSLSKRFRERKRTSLLSMGLRSPAPSHAPSHAPSTRSPSLTSSVTPSLDQAEVQQPPTPTRSLRDFEEDAVPSSPVEITRQEIDYEPIDRQAMASTPLLPPMMVNLRSEENTPLQSPLQSPTVAESNKAFSYVITPMDTPQMSVMPTPPLSTRPSVSSFQQSRLGHMIPASEIPPIMIATPNDKWSMELGHANFIIQPEPYVPDVCDTVTCRQLFADWEQARCNFIKHQVRTGEHYGVTSKTYMLTEQKWTEIDAEWKRSYDAAVSKATETGHEPEALSQSEPAPLIKMPSLNDPKSEGKFPKLGDEDIVGPMVQIASQLQKPSKKSAILKFINEIKFPGSFLSRSSLGSRSAR